MRMALVLLFMLVLSNLSAQTLGGSSTYNFLKLSNSPQLTALGGINVSQPTDDIGMAFQTPSLLIPSMHGQATAVFNDFYAGIQAYHLSLGYRHERLKTNFLWGVSYFNYGSVQETDAGGNLYGQFRPTDWVMQVSASRQYLEKWNYGATLKWVHSNYGQYRSSALAVDVGILYRDSANLFSAGLVARNMGSQIKKYGQVAEELPFDLVAGISQRLAHAPFSFSITAHHLHRFDLRYQDSTWNNDIYLGDNGPGKHVFDKLFRHFVFATTIYLGDKVEAYFSYNHLRRKELNVGNAGNGINGFAIGAGLVLKKLQVRFARSYYQNNTAFNQLGINIRLNQYFGLGKFGEQIGW